ncbi:MULTISPECIES: glycoside hydrolase family 43 protein [Paenibacillus]|jgi:GH43 family beta-xylosidase|uniref:Alpha-N-arabinofuranosidase n=2 Tax=Paenibacillus lactis TaxID=228574 RepID=G4HF10_9BACL|nr:family 43 glycosylhydrolase [Paenibacillus lactis]EHB64327.1 Alpha-N-arabinofuranosidase [Paenibacillus lactis 154]MBP1893057.1 GH43 family beta-xylosidase [Paenibacillus lactis]GIO91914.1 glycosyl hydrolase [Paenibacillus lactis]HAF97482.1 alpha-N-arabinofuranosidase [Paenibacillus lactis]
MSELKLNNPLIEQRADPWIYKHTDGYYYFTASVPEYDRIELRRSRTISGLAETEGTTIWVKHETGWMSANIWAPEIHYIDGKWYVYYAAAHTSETRDGLFDHRMFVLENEAANPLEGEWVEKGQVVTKWESFALDATTFEHRGTRYYVWAQKDPGIPGNSNLYISEMENPWTLKGEQVLISRPEYDWEKQGYLVNEGAAILKRNGRIFMTYSASATDHNYCMGLLTADESSDLLNPTSWVKSPEPVFATSEANGLYGPGHNSFTVSEDGKQDILVYHARSYKEIEGDPLYDPNRHTRVQLIRWNEDGTPNFGVPRPDTKLVNAD